MACQKISCWSLPCTHWSPRWKVLQSRLEQSFITILGLNMAVQTWLMCVCIFLIIHCWFLIANIWILIICISFLIVASCSSSKNIHHLLWWCKHLLLYCHFLLLHFNFIFHFFPLHCQLLRLKHHHDFTKISFTAKSSDVRFPLLLLMMEFSSKCRWFNT